MPTENNKEKSQTLLDLERYLKSPAAASVEWDESYKPFRFGDRTCYRISANNAQHGFQAREFNFNHEDEAKQALALIHPAKPEADAEKKS